MNSQIESRPNSEQHSDARVQATSRIWVYSIPLMGMSIAVAAITRSAIVPIMVAVAPALATLAVWYFGAKNHVAISASAPQKSTEIALQARIEELEERLANLETINNFERRLAEESLRRDTQQNSAVEHKVHDVESA